MTEVQTPPPAPAARLIVPRGDAIRMLKAQLEKGLEIKRAKIRYVPDLERAREAKGDWTTATMVLLRDLFNSSAVADECQAWHGKVLPEYADLNLFIEHFYDEMDQRLRKLHAVLRRLQEQPDETPPKPVASQPTMKTATAHSAHPAAQPSAPSTKNEGGLPRCGALIVCNPDPRSQTAVREFVTRLGLELSEITAKEDARLCDQLDAHASLDFALILTRSEKVPVPFDLGYCVGRLGPKRVYVLAPADDRLTSDEHGLLHIPLDPADGWQLHLARQFKRAGLEVDLNRVF
jgi:hypothetical protein